MGKRVVKTLIYHGVEADRMHSEVDGGGRTERAGRGDVQIGL